MDHIQNDRLSSQALTQALEAAGCTLIRGRSARCPFCDDQKPSGSIHLRDASQAWAFKCHSCGFNGDVWDIRARTKGTSVEDLLRQEGGNQQKGPRPMTVDEVKMYLSRIGRLTHRWAYKNKSGVIQLVVARIETESGKTFRQMMPLDAGCRKWLPKAPDIKLPPLRLPEILAGNDPVVICEGEKAADAVDQHGCIGTTSSMGAGKASLTDWSALAGRHVVLWPDHDEAGQKHMDEVQALLQRLDPPPRIDRIDPNMLGLGPKGDAADYFQLEGSDMVEVLEKAQPVEGPGAALKHLLSSIGRGEMDDAGWPYPILNNYSQSLIPGTVTVIVGRPGGGKSWFAISGMDHWLENDIPFTALMLEEPDTEFHLRRVLAFKAQQTWMMKNLWVKVHAEEVAHAYEQHADYLDRMARRIETAPLGRMSLKDLSKWIEQKAVEGNRVLLIDPVTAADAGEKRYVSDQDFVIEVIGIASKYKISVILVTHPKLGAKPGDMDGLCGGAGYSRHPQTLIEIVKDEPPRRVYCMTGQKMGGEFEINRTVRLLKTRNDIGQGLAIGMNWDHARMRFLERGIIDPSKKVEED